MDSLSQLGDGKSHFAVANLILLALGFILIQRFSQFQFVQVVYQNDTGAGKYQFDP